MKKLKKYSWYCDYGKDKNTQYYIMATSKKQVVELFEKFANRIMSVNYVNNFVYTAWGNDGDKIMDGIKITEPSIYSVYRTNKYGQFESKPIKLNNVK